MRQISCTVFAFILVECEISWLIWHASTAKCRHFSRMTIILHNDHWQDFLHHWWTWTGSTQILFRKYFISFWMTVQSTGKNKWSHSKIVWNRGERSGWKDGLSLDYRSVGAAQCLVHGPLYVYWTNNSFPMSPVWQHLPGLDVSREGGPGVWGDSLWNAICNIHLFGVAASVRERLEVADDHDPLHGGGHGGSGRIGIHLGQGKNSSHFLFESTLTHFDCRLGGRRLSFTLWWRQSLSMRSRVKWR